MTLNMGTTSIGLRPAGVLYSLIISTSSKTGRNISKYTSEESRSRGLPICERASIVNTSSNKRSPIGLRYIVGLSIFSSDLYHKGSTFS